MELDLYRVTRKWKAIKKTYKVSTIILIELILLLIYGAGVVSKGSVSYFFDQGKLFRQTEQGEIFGNRISEENAENERELRTMGVSLERGIYEVSIQYRATNGGTAEIFGQTVDARSIWADRVGLSPEKTKSSFQVWINDQTDGAGVLFRLTNGGELAIDSVRIKTAWNSQLYLVVCFLLKLLLLDAFLFTVMYREELQKHSVCIIGILGITFLCSVGLFNRYMITAHDTIFHMNRIEGLKDGILSGAFPVKIQPTWNNGWGYAVSTLYGDLLFLFPAFMRIIGFTVQTTWKTFFVLINLATALSSFYAFYRMGRDKYKALFATLIYCTGLYRLICMYTRSAVGEAGVMIFLPLVILGFWYAFGEEPWQEGYGTKLIAPVIGFTGMIQTHILTCEMAAFFMIALCIWMIRKVMCRKTFLYLLKIAVFTLLINLWFLVPLFRYLKEDLIISMKAEMEETFQMWGLSVTELFTTTASNAYFFTFDDNVSLAFKCTLTVGLALWGCAVLTLILLWNKRVKKGRAATICLSFGLVSAWLTTNLFPYDYINKYLPALAGILAKIQFPYRFLGLTCTFFCLAVFFALKEVNPAKLKKYLIPAVMLLSAVAVYQGMDYQYQFLYGGACETRYGTGNLDTTGVMTGEYLYLYSSTEVTKWDQNVTGEGVEISGVYKKYLKTDVTCSAVWEGAYIEVPTFYYPGYVAVDDAGKKYTLERSGNNNRIRVELPEDFAGTIHISYQEPVYFRICEVISLLAFMGLLLHKEIEEQMKMLRGAKRENGNGCE